MCPATVIDGLDFENKTSFNQNVDLEGGIENLPIERYWHHNLTFDFQLSPFESTSEDSFVYTFKQTRT